MGRQIVETANRIPNLKPRTGVAPKQHLPARQRMLLIGGPQTGGSQRWIGVVDAFALSHRIEGQHQVSEPRQALTAALVGVRRFAVAAVAHLKQNARIRRLTSGGNVQVRRNMKLRDTFVEQLLEAISLAIDCPQAARVERRGLGYSAGQLPEGLAHPLLPCMNRRRSCELCQLPVSRRVSPLSQVA